MFMTSRYESVCPFCGQDILVGDKIWWQKYKGAKHAECFRTQGAKFKAIVNKAHEAGMAAGEACTPVPMVVEEHSNMADDNSPVHRLWHVPDGVCGFAWIKLPKLTTDFARWAVAHSEETGFRKSSHEPGASRWVHEFNQSMARKEAYARAYTDVLTEAMITAYAGSRID